MLDSTSMMIASGGLLGGLSMASLVGLKGWQGWLELKKLELAGRVGDQPTVSMAGGRIELADLKERVRKLEAIAEGIDI